uniref:DDB1- and CUL4-associated factor 13 n=1 Tax=Leersia perrieri TaxID=77586 RepID=A0A0D9WQJ7_9ORYZ
MTRKVFHNYDPALRTQEKAVEYARALNAAKPFIGAMDGHVDAVSCMAKSPNCLKAIFSGSMDGDIRLWDIASRKTVCHFPGHQGAVRSLATSPDGDLLVSCGVDCTVRLWKVPMLKMVDSNDAIGDASQPSAIYTWKHAFWGVDHQWDGNLFSTVGAQVDIWDQNRSEPINSFEWGKDTVLSVRFNPGELDVLITSARMDIDYSPTGREFVTGSYDRTVRIFQYNGDHSREIYHTKRMQRHRHLPMPIYKASNLRRTMIEAENRKEEKRRAQCAPGSMSVQPFRKRRLIKEVE